MSAPAPMPMPGVRFDHIALALPRMADAPAVLVGLLGGAPAGGAASRVFAWGAWRFAGGGKIEIIEPRGADGFVHRFLARQGPGPHHVTFRVPDLRAACEGARARGYEIVGYDDSDPRWMEAFLHPKQALGIVVQFAESSLDGEGDPRWRPPPGPPDPPAPVTIVGLRLRAHSAERARTQWAALLEARETVQPDGLVVYRWPESPMRIAVEIDPVRDEGPVAVEYAADRDVPLPAGRHPVLGAVFTRTR